MSDHADPLEELEVLLRSRYAVVALPTAEEERAEALLRHVADRIGVPLFVWTRTRGLRRDGADEGVYGTEEPEQALAHVESSRMDALYLLRGFGPELEDRRTARRLRDAATPLEERRGAVVLTGAELALPEVLRPAAATVSLPPPDDEELEDLLIGILRDLNRRGRVEVDQTPEERRALLRNLRGLTLMEAEKVLTRVIVEDGRLDPEDVRRVAEAKRDVVEREGLLEYYPAEAAMQGVADLASLKAWLAKREAFFTRPERARDLALPFPRGVLLLGIPGCGKSLCAKAVASEWGLPLLKLDPSGLYNKFIGETEKNFRRAVDTAERVAPVVLWIDEIEKAFAAGGGGDGGVSRRVLGSFLSWLQEREGDVFVAATANDVSRLPPELLRKGRFDEVFFVDLPDDAARRRIFEIHLGRRDQDPARFDLDGLARATDGFSGAEIEQVVVSGLYTVLSDGGDLTGEILHEEADRTRPLSTTMAEKVRRLRSWAEGRTVLAN